MRTGFTMKYSLPLAMPGPETPFGEEENSQEFNSFVTNALFGSEFNLTASQPARGRSHQHVPLDRNSTFISSTPGGRLANGRYTWTRHRLGLRLRMTVLH
jgi:hypothetical protein